LEILLGRVTIRKEIGDFSRGSLLYRWRISW